MIPTTDDTPTRVALLPDWREGVRLTQEFVSTVQTGRFGLEQRSRKRKRPIYSLEYTRTGLTADEAKQRLEAIRAEYRGPLIVPLWCDGIPLQSDMTDDNAALLDSNPITGEWVAPLDVFIWSDALGGEWRECIAVSGRNLTLDGSGTLYPAGSFVFPSRVMIREASEGMLSAVDIASGSENHRYRTL
jgi:hypothetical protein